MAKKIVEGSGKIKFRFVEFELDGNDASLEEGLKSIAAALNRGMNGAATAPKLIRQQQFEGIPPVDGEAQVEDEHSQDNDEEASSPPKRSSTPRKVVPRRILVDFKLDVVQPTLKEFAAEKAPRSDLSRYLVIAYWSKYHKKVDDLTPDHFYTAYRYLGWSAPKDPAQPARDLTNPRDGRFSAGSIAGTVTINHVGEESVLKMGKTGCVINLASFVEDIPYFHQKSDAEKIEVFGWYLHEVKQQDRFGVADLHGCFDAVHITRPANTSSVLARLFSRKPPRILKDSQGYRLAAPARTDLGQTFSVRATTVRTTAILDGLVPRVTDGAQKTFLVETLTCFKNKAYRAAIVMAWNLAFSDVLDRILKSHLVEFNAQRAKAFPKTSEVRSRSDFEDFQESRIIEIARGAGILSASSAKILKEKLDKRNTAAHPSVVVVRDITAEEVIHDLVENIILRPTL